jgi:hypothetical protein
VFGAMMWKLLIIEPFFFNEKLNKIKTENFIGNLGGVLGVVGKPLGELDSNRV